MQVMNLRLLIVSIFLIGATLQSAFAFGMYPPSDMGEEVQLQKNTYEVVTVKLKNDGVAKTVEFYAKGAGLEWNDVRDKFSQQLSFAAYEEKDVALKIEALNSEITVNAEYGVIEGTGMFQTVVRENVKVIVGSGSEDEDDDDDDGGGSSSSGGGGGGGGSSTTTKVNYTSTCAGTYVLKGGIWVCQPRAGVVANISNVTVKKNESVVVPTAIVQEDVEKNDGVGASIEDVAVSDGGIAQGVVDTRSLVSNAEVTQVQETSSVRDGFMSEKWLAGVPLIGHVAMVLGVLALCLQGASIGALRRSDVL